MTRNIVPVAVEVDGVRLSGSYAVQSGMVTVWNAVLGSRTRTVVGEIFHAHAEELLAELYQARRMEVSARGRRHG